MKRLYRWLGPANGRKRPGDRPGVEYNHFANISKAAERSRDTPAAIARFTLDSRSKRDQALSFGFSDRVKIFVNGRQIYSGDDSYLSRDYRFLGTVGFL